MSNKALSVSQERLLFNAPIAVQPTAPIKEAQLMFRQKSAFSDKNLASSIMRKEASKSVLISAFFQPAHLNLSKEKSPSC